VVDGRASGKEELSIQPLKRPGHFCPHNPSRRTCFVAWCGVFFFVATLFPGCTRRDPPSPLPPRELTIGVPEAVAGSDTGLQNLASVLSLEGLTQLSADGRALPRLAEKWSWENDARQLRVQLAAGVKFHDGTPLTAELVAGLLRDASTAASNRALYPSLGDITAVEAEGPLDVVIRVSTPSAFLPEDIELPISIKSPPVGTGAFRVVRIAQDVAELEGFQGYRLGPPDITRLIARPIGTLRTAWASLLRGEVDMITDVPPEAVEFIRNDEVEVLSFERRYQYVIAFNSAKAPFNSPSVGRALNIAINRDAVITRVLGGRGTPSTGPIWPSHWAYDRSLPTYGFDAAGARAMLDAAGLRVDRSSLNARNRLRFTCIIPARFMVTERLALEIQKQFYDVGVDMQVEVLEPRALDSRLRSGTFDAVLLDMISGPTIERGYQFWRSRLGFEGLNLFGYENAEAERFYKVLRRSANNEAAVRSATSGLQRALFEHPPALFLAWNQRARAVRRNFQINHETGRDPIQMLWRSRAPTGLARNSQ
jgi:peptide/nickel transport system substrate-binding protein